MLLVSTDRVPDHEHPRLLRRASELEGLAAAHYRRSALGACADCSSAVERIARALGDDALWLRARFWHATSLHGLGLHEESLALMEEALGDDAFELDDPFLYLIWTRALRAEIELPRPLAEIEASFHALERALGARHLPARRSRLLLNRARLALSRGRLGEAIEFGEEALERQRSETSTYTTGAHYWPLVTACTWAGELHRAQQHLRRWSELGSESRTSTVFLLTRKAELARREGALGAALELARDAFGQALGTDEHQLRVFAGHALCQAQLATGDTGGARGVLAWLLRARHCEFGEHAHMMRWLAADLALAEARRLGGLRTLDAELGVERAHTNGPRAPVRAAARLALARRLYERSEPRGRALDAALACGFRAHGLHARLALVDRTRAALEAR